jgi:hypothetical protein
MSGTAVPSEDCYYLCNVFQVPPNTKWYILVTKGNKASRFISPFTDLDIQKHRTQGQYDVRGAV